MLLKALQEKQAYLKANGIEGFIATQFLFEAEPVAEWARMLRAAGIDLPIHVGVPGPATIKTLVKYAAMCGVGNSARFIRKQALNITKLLTVNTPDDFVAGLAQLHYGRPELGIAGPHLYPFGGFDKLFDWVGTALNAADGKFWHPRVLDPPVAVTASDQVCAVLPAEQLHLRGVLRRGAQEVPGVVRVGAEDVDVEDVVFHHMQQGRDFGEAHAAAGAGLCSRPRAGRARCPSSGSRGCLRLRGG